MKELKYILIIFVGFLCFACAEDDTFKIEDHYMYPDIPNEPLTADHTVGAFYYSFEWASGITETPAAGLYEAELGDPTAYDAHIAQASTGGIDYFIFRMRSLHDTAQFQADSAFIDTLQRASNAANMNFALAYDFESMDLSDTRRIESEGLVPTFLNDFQLMLPYFQQSNYMKVDGACVVYIEKGSDLHSDDNEALTSQLRTQMSGLGVELYLIGNQQEWTPPLRYEMRFINCVDAVAHDGYIQITKSWYDRYPLFLKLCNQAWPYHRDRLADFGLDYIPTVSPSFDERVSDENTQYLVFEKDPQFFRDYCNVARRAAGTQRMILLDSFNDWNKGSQVEAASGGYGSEYLTILRQEFKTN